MVVSLQSEQGIALVIVDNPPVNAISQAVRLGLQQAVRSLDEDDSVQAVILACAGRTFIAGADVKEFGKPAVEPHLPDVIQAIEEAKKPWIAALHGTALGGGFEIALGCHYRIALQEARIGLPEVTLGLIPGAGGTTRLPRLIGVAAALAMMTDGKAMTVAKAKDLGAIDHIVAGREFVSLLDAAKHFAQEVSQKTSHPRLSQQPSPAPNMEDFWEQQEKTLRKKAKGQDSPLAVLQAVRWAVEKPFAEAMADSRRLFLSLRESPQAAALRHVFFAERMVGKIDSLEDISPRAIDQVAVIGGGTMGSGIAACFLDAGLTVTLLERDAEALEKGLANIQKIYDGAVAKGRLAEADREKRLRQLSGVTDYAALDQVDLAIEAVFEDLEVKKDVFRALDRSLKPGALLATNTSYLDPNAIASAVARPKDVIGLHFFSPAHIMKLLEVIATAKTAPDVLATGMALGKRLKKIAVCAGVCDGFIGNRILAIYRRQADYLLLDGALPAEIDQAMRAFGMPMGPYEAQDLGGLDIAWANRKRKAATRPAEERYAPIADSLCERGRFGQKTGKGWYGYQDGDRTPHPDPEVEAIILEASQNAGITRQSFSLEERQQRLLFPMINEGLAIVEEGIALRPLDVDLVKIHGYGFPRWRGGLLHYGDAVGVKTLYETLTAWAQEDSYAYTPCRLLTELYEKGETIDHLNNTKD